MRGGNAGFGYAQSINENWAGLLFAQSLDRFNAYRIRAAALSTNFGTGIMADYSYNTDLRLHTSVANVLQVLPRHKNVLLAPVIGGGDYR